MNDIRDSIIQHEKQLNANEQEVVENFVIEKVKVKIPDFIA